MAILLIGFFLERLFNLQEKEGLKLGNKITKCHIDFSSQKMKVKLATQLLSTSVADALTYCNKKGVNGFEGCQGTVKFIRVFNDLFDILNSKNLTDKNFKRAINESNADEIMSTLEECESYIRGLKQENGQSVCSSRRKTGFVGFLVCIKSTKELYSRLVVQDKKLKFLPMYKTSQDHIERLFGYIRSRGGHNDNPSALAFTSLFKKILVHKQLHENSSSSGNVIPLDKINILGITPGSKTSSVKKINSTTLRSRMIEAQTEGNKGNIYFCLYFCIFAVLSYST